MTFLSVFLILLGIGSAKDQLNVIFITADDLSASRLGCYGNKVVKTPRLDDFAKEALLFERTYCQVPQCGQSRTSIFTGVRPETSGLWKLNHDWKKSLPKAVSMQRHFSDQGFNVISVGKLFDPRTGKGDFKAKSLWGFENADKPISELKKLSVSKQPFALFIGFKEPHPVNWEEPKKRTKYKKFIDLYEPENLKLQGPVMWSGQGDKETREALATAYGVISYLDYEVGRLLKAIKAEGLWDKTIVIFACADHGYRLGERGGSWAAEKWGKWYPGEIDSRVPLMIRLPRSKSIGKRTSAIIECIDLYPTLIELCGLDDTPQKLEGHSFATLFSDPRLPWKEAAFTSYGSPKQIRSVVNQRYRFIQEEDAVKLYDLKLDPKGLNDIASSNETIVRKMSALLAAGPNHDWNPAVKLKSEK